MVSVLERTVSVKELRHLSLRPEKGGKAGRERLLFWAVILPSVMAHS